ncbi:MAG: hypothetical protein IH898_07985 [Planctomycetes bacterium]|nr:hypothetical protein [Planctomycetota bacterium]
MPEHPWLNNLVRHWQHVVSDDNGLFYCHFLTSSRLGAGQNPSANGLGQVQTIEISLRRDGDGWYWDGSIWTSNSADPKIWFLTTPQDFNIFTVDYNPVESDSFTIRAEARDAADALIFFDGAEERHSINVVFDRDPPTAILQDLAPWISQAPQLDISGTDGESGVVLYSIFVSIFDNSTPGGLTPDWSNPSFWQQYTEPSNPIFTTSSPSKHLRHNHTFEFLLEVEDAAGNKASATSRTTLDHTSPTCTIAGFPQFTDDSTVSWTHDDTFFGLEESGVAEVSIELSSDGVSWDNPEPACPSNPFPDFILSADCVLSEQQWWFRCNATDTAGNTGSFSTPETTTIDLTRPSSRIIFPNSLYINTLTIDLEWEENGIDPSGIASYELN